MIDRMFHRSLTTCLAAALALVWVAAASAATVWVEGEDAHRKNVTAHPWYDSVKAEALSGGKWLGHFDDDKIGEASYRVAIPEAGAYRFHLRANPVAAKLRYRIDGGDWREVGFGGAIDRHNVAADDAVDLRFVGWVDLGTVKLTRGRHTIDFRMESDNHHHGAIDALVLTTEPFVPDGKAKPGERGEIELADEQGRWAFPRLDDPFTDEAMLDLRHLNERESGEHGFIRLSDDGNGFVRGDGQPIRFWSVASYGFRLPPDQMDRHARFLAKLGVNMVRLHANIAGTNEGDRLTDVDKETIDRIFRFIKACKDNGIYLTISPYWYHHKMPESWTPDLPGYKKGDMPSGALFFNPDYQAAYKQWIKYFYTTRNPYTGLAIKDDPSVAILQVKNEDSLLFWTSQRIPAEQVEILGRQYHRWLAAKYGSIERAYAAWDGQRIGDGGGAMGKLGDAPDQGRMALYIIWELTQDREGGKQRRLTDQLQFMAETQYNFYQDIVEYCRRTLGCKQRLFNANNWKTADPARLGDAERWSYTAANVIAVNRYFSGTHEGANNGWRIDPGHRIAHASVTRSPHRMPTNLKQIDGAPMLITESLWVRPNRYQAEAAMMTAAYLSLTGVDSLYWFAHGEADYQYDPRRLFNKVGPGDTGYALSKWSVATPAQQGMFPAAALMFRNGYVAEGQTVAHEHRSLEEIRQRQPSRFSEAATFDPNRDLKDLRTGQGRSLTPDQLAYLVGPVRVTYGSDPNRTRTADLTPHIDAEAGVVRANTGQIALDWRRGLFTLDAPKAKGVAGFLKDAGGKFELDGLTIASDNDYAAIQLVALDDQPLNRSARVLVQVGTTNRLTGWATRPVTIESDGRSIDGREIVATGKPPWQIEHTRASITLANPRLTRATLLDPSGYPDRAVPVNRADGNVSIDLPHETMYLILH